MMNCRITSRNEGFTLIEVVVALAILTWVLGSAIFLVNQYANERIRMRESFIGNQVAWNQLMDQYSVAQGWRPENASFTLETQGQELQAGQRWYWQLQRTSASGQNLYRYRVDADFIEEEVEEQAGASLTLFLIEQDESL